MKFLQTLLLPLFLIASLFPEDLSSQSINVTSTGSTSGNDVRTFSFDRSKFQVSGSNVAVSGSSESPRFSQVLTFDVAPTGNFLGVVHADGELHTTWMDGTGAVIGENLLTNFDPMDRTFQMFMFDDGRFAIRDNVANFSFFNEDGVLSYRISNSTGSTEGEAVSEMIADPSGSTVLLYNPRVRYSDGEGSRARIIRGERNIIDLYQSRDRTLKYADITDNGSYLVLVTEQAGTNDEVLVFDRFGNRISDLATEEELVAVDLSEDGSTLTIFSSNRVQVYRTTNLERISSASFRSRVSYATYEESDEQIIALCGYIDSNNRITDPEIHAVHLGKRSIARTEIDIPLAFLSYNQISVQRTGSSRFELRGLNRNLDIQTHFP